MTAKPTQRTVLCEAYIRLFLTFYFISITNFLNRPVVSRSHTSIENVTVPPESVFGAEKRKSAHCEEVMDRKMQIRRPT